MKVQAELIRIAIAQAGQYLLTLWGIIQYRYVNLYHSVHHKW